MDPDVWSFMGVMATIAGFILAMTLVRAVSNRFCGPSRGNPWLRGGEPEELAQLRERVADLEYTARRVEELEERMDFAERLLAEAPVRERVAGGAEPADTPL